jgi:hypothetical protein
MDSGEGEDTAICQLCGDRAEAEIPVADLGAHFRLFHPDAGVTEETIAQAEFVDETGRDA